MEGDRKKLGQEAVIQLAFHDDGQDKHDKSCSKLRTSYAMKG